jgi:DUF4097 and DUF4098 domain-containing protein YvlB
MSGYPPPYPPPGSRPPYGPNDFRGDWKYQRRILRDQARAQREVFRAQRDAYRAQYRGLRRGSIVGPILVIAIGVVFLLVQLGKLPSFAVWAWLGHWWPLLLIGVGVIVLIEWGFDQTFRGDTGQPYVRRSLGGGVITLLVLLIIGGVVHQNFLQGLHDGWSGESFNQENIDQFLGDKHESEQTLDQPFAGEGTLQVDNPRGDVTISGTSDDNQIHVSVHKEVYSRSDSDAANKSQQLSPKLDRSGSITHLSLPSLDGARADLVITVPSISSNTVVANHGDVKVSGVRGSVNITANHGDVELSAITGSVTTHIQNSGSDFSAHSVTGPVTLEGRGGSITLSDINGPVSVQGDFFGDTHVEHIRAAFRFHTSRTDFQLARLDGQLDISSEEDLSADQVVGPVVLNTRNRNITLDRVAGDVTVTNKNGKIDLTGAPPLGNVSIENRNGEVSVTVPDQAGFNVQAETTEGDIENDFALPVSESNNRKSIAGNVGKPSANIKITTSQEDISLKRASIAPLPPLPPTPPALTDMPAGAKRALVEAKKSVKEAQKAAAEAQKAAQEAAKTAQQP